MAIFGALAALATAIAQANAANAGTNLGYANLNFQKQRDRDQRRLATATRGDIYGNKQRYDQALNEFLMELTPTQQQITKAGEREQLLSLTEDAKRNRDTRRRQERRATLPYTGTEDVFDRLISDFLYKPPPDEEAIRGRNQLQYGAELGDAVRTAASGLGQQAIRLGRGGDVGSIIREIGRALGGMQVGGAAQGRDAARGEAMQREQGHQSRHLPALQQFAGLTDAVGSAPQLFGNLAQTMSGQQSEIMRGLANALASGASNIGGAYSDVARLVASGAPDFTGVGTGLDKALAQLMRGGSGGTTSGGTTSRATVTPSGAYNFSPFNYVPNQTPYSERLKREYTSTQDLF